MRPGKCRELEVVRLVEEDLPARRRARLERHLDDCAACRKALDDYRALRSLLLSLPPVRTPASWPATARPAATRWRPAFPVLPTAGALAGLVVAFLLVAFLRPGGEQVEPGPRPDPAVAAALAGRLPGTLPKLEDYYLVEGLPEPERSVFLELVLLADGNGAGRDGGRPAILPENLPRLPELESYYLFEVLTEEEKPIFINAVQRL